ncbi:MAG TPA: M20/M25/M40 family metallo-hydrolase [Ktedonobacteraceae bacterium]|nr:M20/M25/M40 family metallo-hydrolase [Ktedonobacteraceae bacterium]
MQTPAFNDWYAQVKAYTTRLVNIRSVSPGQGEIEVARETLSMLREDGLEHAYTAIGLDPVVGDASGRQNACAFLRGNRPDTIVLLGHIDTVDTKDFGALEPFALDPAALATHQQALADMAPGLAEDITEHSGDWMFGRGSVDMKSGVAANVAVMRHMARLAHHGQLSLSVVFIATPDEENESAGVLQAVQYLLRLRQEYGLSYLGAINTDYTTALYPGDTHRYIYTGSVGKLLPTFLLIGHASHVGEPFDGVDANLLAAELIRDLSMNDDLCDVVRGQRTPPPVTLKASDLKTSYDVQLPFAAYFYLNVLTFSTTPAQLLERLRGYAQSALDRVLQRLIEVERRWTSNPRLSRQSRSGIVLTYAELYAQVEQQMGHERVQAEIKAVWNTMPGGLDSRGRCLHLARHLWTASGKKGPAIILYYSPPFIPHIAEMPCLLHTIAHTIAEVHPELQLEVHEYFPFISDMSYLRLDPGFETSALTTNIPSWQEQATAPHAGTYQLPLAAIQKLGLPVINFGPYGKGAHQTGERVLMSYSFGTLPQLLCEVIERLAQETEAKVKL